MQSVGNKNTVGLLVVLWIDVILCRCLNKLHFGLVKYIIYLSVVTHLHWITAITFAEIGHEDLLTIWGVFF